MLTALLSWLALSMIAAPLVGSFLARQRGLEDRVAGVFVPAQRSGATTPADWWSPSVRSQG